jgi:hypothetical protein
MDSAWTPILVGVGLVLLAGVAAIGGLYFFAVRHRRDDEAAALQTALTEPLAREPTLAGAGVVPVVTWPGGRRPRVELTGWVRSRGIGDAAVRAVEREARKLGRSVRIIDALQVIEHEQRRGA